MALVKKSTSLHLMILVTAATLLVLLYSLPLYASDHRPLYPLELYPQHGLPMVNDSLSTRTVPPKNIDLMRSNPPKVGITDIFTIRPTGTQVQRNATDIERRKRHFVVTISNEEREMFRSLMKTFADAATDKVTYFMYSGTLIGSYRHHGMIPWDDDLDLFVNEADKEKLFEALSALGPDFITRKVSHTMKFYHRSTKRTKFGWNWPFLDIFFFRDNGTHFWDSHPSWKGHRYLKGETFPLTKRPFMGMLLPAPRNTAKALGKQYDVETCETKFYDHKNEEFMGKDTLTSVPCVELEDTFAFVKRRYEGNTIIETLTDKSGNVSSFSVIR